MIWCGSRWFQIGMTLMLSVCCAVFVFAGQVDLPGILGKDDRKPLNTAEWPWSAIGRVNLPDGMAYCTGVLIEHNKVLTAAHCLFNPRSGHWLKPAEIVFIPDFRPGFDYEYAKAVAITRGLSRPLEKIDMAFIAQEWAILTLDKSLSQRPVPVRVLAADWSGNQASVNLQTGGYSMDRPYMLSVDYACRIQSRDMNDAVLITDCDSTKGNSGSPVLVNIGARDWFVVGVFSSASGADSLNQATYAVGAKVFSGRY